MRRHAIVKAGLYPLVAAGTLFAVGGLAEPAAASPPTVVAVPADCDVTGGQPGGEHAPGGHDSHGMVGGSAPTTQGQMEHSMPMGDGQMDHSMPMGDGQMDHGQMEHGGHGAGSMATAEGPDSASRSLVLGGFAGVNGAALAGAGLLRRRTASKRERHTTARAAARPARTAVSGDQR
jgi:uncharacterized protein involved in copper resistance